MNPAIARRRHAKVAAARRQETGSPRHQHGGHKINVGQTERQISLIGGGVLAIYGLVRGSLSGLTLAALGGALIWRGYSGHCEMYHQLGYSTADAGNDEPDTGLNSGQARGQSVTADVAI